MTVVEFFDNVPIENILSALICIRPTRVIMVGQDLDKMKKSIGRFERILTARSLKVEMIPCLVFKNNLTNIVDRLSRIVETYNDCVFDLTGGEDLYLTGIGVLIERLGNRIQCHRFNLNNDTLTDCDADGNVCATGSFNVSAEENIIINGGVIVKESTFAWSGGKELETDVENAFAICRQDPRAWNDRMGMIGALCEMFGDGGTELSVSFDKKYAMANLKRKGVDFAGLESTLKTLEERGLVTELYADDSVLTFRFKNGQIRKILTVSGQALELFVATRLKALKDENGNALYHDVRVGVVVDWDEDSKDRYRTVNEIDVLAMRGAVPVFISCKNGDFDAEELYKLFSVAERFGSKYAKKAIVISAFDAIRDELRARHLEERMNDMGIYPIKNVDKMSADELDRKLRALHKL